jgi:hypothetical protein
VIDQESKAALSAESIIK